LNYSIIGHCIIIVSSHFIQNDNQLPVQVLIQRQEAKIRKSQTKETQEIEQEKIEKEKQPKQEEQQEH